MNNELSERDAVKPSSISMLLNLENQAHETCFKPYIDLLTLQMWFENLGLIKPVG